ncbi:MAG: chromate transporter [Alistipes sp.]|nr:chromate transporter [Alistipes sp.]
MNKFTTENRPSKGTPLGLFWSFLKIGVFTFGGGYAMIPLMQREVVDKQGWVPRERFLELLTLAQSAPGPISLNTAVFVGYSLRGMRGAVAGVMGIVVPSFVIILLVAIYFTGIRHNPVFEAAFKGMRPAVVALIVAPIFGLAKGMGPWRLILAAAAAVLVWKAGLSPIWLIVAGAAGGILWFNFFKGAAKNSVERQEETPGEAVQTEGPDSPLETPGEETFKLPGE